MADAIPGVLDQDLISSIRAGDGIAFEKLFNALYPDLVSLCIAKVQDEDAAKDIACGVFADLFFRRASWAPGPSIRAYFVRAVLNKAINFHRDSRSTGRRDATLRHEIKAGAFGGFTLPPDLSFEAEEDSSMRQARIDKAIAELPERYQMVLRLRWQQDLSFSEIAQALEINEVAVRKLLSRATQRLKEVLAKASQKNG